MILTASASRGPTVMVLRCWCDREHEARLAVGGRCAEPKTPPLPDGKAVRSGMLANLGAGDVDDVAWPDCRGAVQESGSVSVGDEADVVTVGLVRDSQAAIPGLGAYLGLAGETERKIATGEVDHG